MTSNNGEPASHVAHLPLSGLEASWSSIELPGKSADRESVNIDFENEAWTLQGIVSGVDIHYVIRLSALWKVQQMLLFRDLEEPDLWIANDGKGRWGEINGSQRRELGGCEDIDVRGSALTCALAIRRLHLDVGEHSIVDSVVVNPESLAITRARLMYTRRGPRTWSIERDDGFQSHQIEVDDFGLPLDIPGHFSRTT